MDTKELKRAAEVLGLKPTVAYVPTPAPADVDTIAKKRRQNADRQARHRAKLDEQGLAPVRVPVELARQVAEAGSWSAWQANAAAAAVAAWQATAPATPVSPAPAPAASTLSEADRSALELGQNILSLAGWRGWLVRWLLS